jgi:hypothetical protein
LKRKTDDKGLSGGHTIVMSVCITDNGKERLTANVQRVCNVGLHNRQWKRKTDGKGLKWRSYVSNVGLHNRQWKRKKGGKGITLVAGIKKV